MKRQFILICLLSLFSMLTVSCSHDKTFMYDEGVAWNTVYHITYESDRNLSDSILIIFEKIDCSLSPFNPDSRVSKINKNISDSTDNFFEKVYAKSIEIHKQTEGAFDPTLAPLIRAWGFGQGHKVTVDTLKLDSLLKIVGINKTRLKDGRLFKDDPDIEFNFSALAKGFGVDCIAEMLERNGVENYLVEVGGEIRCRGHNSSGKKWGIGIDRPEAGAPNGETVLTIYCENGGIATSGNYRNFQNKDGKIFGHTISPKTGKPVETDVISATVITSDCMEADALATSCMVMGKEKALNLCNRLGAGVMLVTPQMEVVMNSTFKHYLKN